MRSRDQCADLLRAKSRERRSITPRPDPARRRTHWCPVLSPRIPLQHDDGQGLAVTGAPGELRHHRRGGLTQVDDGCVAGGLGTEQRGDTLQSASVPELDCQGHDEEQQLERKRSGPDPAQTCPCPGCVHGDEGHRATTAKNATKARRSVLLRARFLTLIDSREPVASATARSEMSPSLLPSAASTTADASTTSQTRRSCDLPHRPIPWMQCSARTISLHSKRFLPAPPLRKLLVDKLLLRGVARPLRRGSQSCHISGTRRTRRSAAITAGARAEA